ncbi:MAG: virulence-associated E family protein [Youngiibacter sp.]|nr:virulence-associated E family protein [Youngiibacter sp.]
MIVNNRKLLIARANSRQSKNWPAEEIYWSQFIELFKQPVRTSETYADYMGYSVSKQGELKDVGGFVGGTFTGNRRKASTVATRDLVTLDLDNIASGATNDILKRVDSLGCAYVVYSTRKHSSYKPRLRVIIPTDRTMQPDEYEPTARKLGQILGIENCDPTTFEASRLMYWPSTSSDGEYVYLYGDKGFLSVDGTLAMYKDWHDVREWPEVPGSGKEAHLRLIAKQGNPLDKSGVVGAFCKTYNIYRAIETFIPYAYSTTDVEDRMTFSGGSTTGGAVIYDYGNFLFSHHATDPCSGKLVNAFDLIRLHLFGDLDDAAKDGTPPGKLPSYTAMAKRAVEDMEVSALLSAERYTKATQEFAAPEVYTDWLSLLEVNKTTGEFMRTTRNVAILLKHDPNLTGRIHKNLFTDCILGTAPLPWGNRTDEGGPFHWTDDDDAGLRMYIEGVLGFRSREVIDDALRNHAITQGINPLREYLESAKWDGVKRLDTLYIDYFGAHDSAYMRTIARKAFVAAVARVMTPGVKFDYMTVINGPQGVGKSTFFKLLGKDWFSDSLKTFEGKDAAELLQGVWILEIGELEAMNKSEITTIKQFLTKTDDQYRAAYARKTERHLRQCVFFGTTNNQEYLRDTTGNRRFWPVEAGKGRRRKLVFRDLEGEVDQIWAEAYAYWVAGESLYLDPEMELIADEMRSSHMERDPLQGQIEEFIDKPIPEDWNIWGYDRRKLYWQGAIAEGIKLVKRDRICAVEIWKECFNEYRNMPKFEAQRINGILENLQGWDRAGIIKFGGGYGKQRGFKPLSPNA